MFQCETRDGIAEIGSNLRQIAAWLDPIAPLRVAIFGELAQKTTDQGPFSLAFGLQHFVSNAPTAFGAMVKKSHRGRALDSIFSFNGRTSRLGWLSCNVAGGLLIAPFFVGLQIGDAQFTALSLVLAIPGMIIALASHARRLHDIGLSGWLLVMGLIPFASTLMMFVYLFIPGSGRTEQTAAAPST